MASTYTPLGVELQATGENAGTWGTKTNTNLQIIEQIAGGFTQQALTSGGTVTLGPTDGGTGAVVSHRMIEFTGSLSGNAVVTIPLDVQTFYFLRNSSSGSYTVQFKYVTGSGSSVTFAATDKGDKIVIATANDSSNPDIKEVALGIASVAADTSPQLGGDLDMNGQDIVTTSNADIELAPNGTGHVTVKGNTNQGTIQFNCENNSHGQQVKAAPHSESASNVLTLPSTGGDARLVSATSTATLTNKTLTAPKIADAGFIADANGAEQIIFQTTASAVNEVEITNAATGNGPIIGSSGETNVDLNLTPKGLGRVSLGAASIQNVVEKITVSATAATGTINYDVITQAVLYYTSAATGNFTVNFRGDGSNTLNAIMSTGQSLTVAFLVTCTGSAYYNNAVTIDGSSITPEWQGGSAPSAGNANSIDAYTYTIIKTGDGAFTALAAQTQYA